MKTEAAFDSPGGLVIKGLGSARFVRSTGICSALVRLECASACTLFVITGEQTAAPRNAALGFHRSYTSFGDFGIGWGPTENRMVNLLRHRGVSEAFIQRAFSVPGWDIYEPTVVVLQAEGVVTEVR